MKHINKYGIGLLLLLVALLPGCGTDENNPTPTVQNQTDLIVANGWQLTQVNDTQGRALSQNQLNLTTAALFSMEMQFRANGTVRALDLKTRQILNGGSWKFTDDLTSMDVDVTGFRGQFGVRTLTSQRLVLRQHIKVNGTDQDADLEFKPAI